MINLSGKTSEFFVFTDDKYYEYSDIYDEVKPNGTKYISDRFGPKPGSTTTVPNNLNSVLFDPRNDHLFFFKDEWVSNMGIQVKPVECFTIV